MVKFLLGALLLVTALTGCLSPRSDWTRRDMPTDGLQWLVTYNLRGPAGTEQELNQAHLRGVNENAPTKLQSTFFDRMSGTKTQDVQVTLPDGRVYQALGMNKPKRFAGLTRFMTLEPATYSAVDFQGKAICGAKIRLDFNRNFLQYADPEKRDYQSLWYYDVPCQKQGADFVMDTDKAKLRAVVLNQVWQFRVSGGSWFFNWGHSVTAVDGLPSKLPGSWWKHWDIPDNADDVKTIYDAIGAGKIVNAMVRDLEQSPQPWLEFSPSSGSKTIQYDKDGWSVTPGGFAQSGTYLIYSAGDADRYATLDRLLLNRQREYVVAYRPNKTTQWDWIRIQPLYNMEWNDVMDNLRAIKGWGTFNDHLDANGIPKPEHAEVVKELERVGYMNAPNTDLDQICWYGSDGKLLYVMTVRAHIGASDTLILFGRGEPDFGIRKDIKAMDVQPRPLVYDDKGQPMPQEQQPYTAEQWAEWQREATFWNFLKDNPNAVGADLMIQYRFADNTKWAPITCRDSEGHSYTCGYRPVEWDLSTSYYFDGNARKPWLISQLLGEVGVRTLGMSYVSGRYEGTGLIFAMAQLVHREEFLSGYKPESIWRFDARASQLPDTLDEAWKTLQMK